MITGEDSLATKPDVAALVRELRATLDQIGDALVNGSFDDLVATESRLAGIAGTFGASGFGTAMSANEFSPVPPSEVDAALSGVDALLMPTLPIVAPPIGAATVQVGTTREPVRNVMLRLTQLFNLTGHPAVSLPCGTSASGLPCGLQLAGSAGQTDTLLHVARGVEMALGG